MMSSHNSLLPPPPASCPSDCIVGPTEIELSDPAFISWGKRKNRRGGDGGNNTTPALLASVADSTDHCNPNKKQKHSDDGASRNKSNSDDIVSDDGVSSSSSQKNRNSSNKSGSNSSFREAIDTFLSSGCCVIPTRDVLPPEFVQLCLDRAKKDYTFLESLLEKERELLLNSSICQNGDHGHYYHHRIAASTRQDYAEWLARDGGRVDIRYKMNEHPYNCGGLIYNSIVFPLVKALLNGHDNIDNNDEPIQLLYTGVMWGMPVVGSESKDSNTINCSLHKHQKWHADGGHLFSKKQLPNTLPPHCINVFYPLVDLTKENGPTEFRIGSHRHDSSSKECKEFPLLCPAGGAVLFDYRVQHRGLANNNKNNVTLSSKNGSIEYDDSPKSNIKRKENTACGRPILYLAYAKNFFKDHGNTRSGRRLDPNSAGLWTSRTLTGRPVPYGEGFENYNNNRSDDGSISKATKNGKEEQNGDAISAATDDICDTGSNNGVAATGNNNSEKNENYDVGERWILFQMTLELPNGTLETLQVHKDDIPREVAEQFVLKHQLQNDFVAVLTKTIQTQMYECCNAS